MLFPQLSINTLQKVLCLLPKKLYCQVVKEVCENMKKDSIIKMSISKIANDTACKWQCEINNTLTTYQLTLVRENNSIGIQLTVSILKHS